MGMAEFNHGPPLNNSEDSALWATLLNGNTQEGGLNAKKDFNIRSWQCHRVYSSRHSEIAALAQALETVSTIVKHQKPSSGISVTIFSDSKDSLNRLRRAPRALDSKDMTKSDALSMSLLRTIIWQSHYLTEE